MFFTVTSPTTVFYSTRNQYRQALVNRIPKTEYLRAQQYTNPERQQLFVLGRYLLSQALMFLGETQPYTLYYATHGKPKLITPAHWQFNLTHSGAHLFLALRQHHSIGIDSELLLPRNYQRLAEKLFNKDEQTDIAQASNPMQTFYRLWTRYEAQIKHLGLSVYSTLPANTRHLRSYALNDIVLSLCCDTPFEQVHFYQHQPNENATFTPLSLPLKML